ncbi:MAG: hypothetical protein ACW98U_14850 [Candidatus Thorarchaeota archaeon]
MAPEPFDETWTHIDISRNSTGGIHVWVNGTPSTDAPNITVVDPTYDYSERFLLYHHGAYAARFDNIVVDDEVIDPIVDDEVIDTTTTTSTTPTTNGGQIDPTLLIVGAGVAGVVIVAAVVCMRRR